MISSHYVTAVSSWKEGTPSSLSAALALKFDNDNCIEECRNHRYSKVELKPRDDVTNGTPVTVNLRCERYINITSVAVVTNAGHLEVYDNRGEYTSTVRGERVPDGDAQGVQFKKSLAFDTSLPSCSLKFLSLADKGCLRLSSLEVRVRKVEPAEEAHLTKRQIDMVKVRDLLSAMARPVPENVERLMQTVEQYQDNQSSVWRDVQQQAQKSASNYSPAGPMAGMLSMLAKTSEMSRTGDSNALAGAVREAMPSAHGDAAHAPGDELYCTLQGICKNVSQMRTEERRKTNDDRNVEIVEKAEKEATGTEKDSPPVLGDPRLAEMLEENVSAQLEVLEERMMGRLERRLDALESHLELRLNRIESMVSKLAERLPPARGGGDQAAIAPDDEPAEGGSVG